MVNGKVYLEKHIRNTFRIIYDLDGLHQDGFNRKGFDRDRYNKKGINENGYNRDRELACKEKLKQIIRENTYTYQYATLRLKNNVDLAMFFREQCGSFSLISKHLRKFKTVVMVAVGKNPNSFQYIGKNLKDDDEMFKLTFQQKKYLDMQVRHCGKVTINHNFIVLIFW